MIDGKIGCEFECCIPREVEVPTEDPELKTPQKVAGSEIVSKKSEKVCWDYGYDRSVRTNENNCPCEIRSKPYKISELASIFEDFKVLEPYLVEVNSSSGFHIHVSFNQMQDYYKLCCYDFVKKFESLIREKFISDEEKLRLQNSYCAFYKDEKDFIKTTNEQISSGNMRYKAVNFASFGRHHTIEFRIFPGVNKINDFKKYVNMLLDFVEDYLHIKKIDPIQVKINKIKVQEDVVIREEL